MVELLAPVRDRVSFTAALQAGADSVYFGLGELNMRVSSKGIEPDELPEIVGIAHGQGVKVYVTINSVIFDEELDSVDRLLGVVRDAGVDAVICWDFGVIQKARAMGLAVHVSTQASVANSEAARFYQSMGAERVVLARELSLEQVATIHSQCDIELEAFAHGAMCVSVSGRCFMSQYLSGHSANRGACLQPCRREYLITDQSTQQELIVDDHHVLSPKDLCTLPILDRMVEAGIGTFKIEGRARAPEYIATVTAAYREALDAVAEGRFDKDLVDRLMAKLKTVYNRDFSTGFYLGIPGPHDWADSAGNQATHKKLHVGKVINYYSQVQVAFVKIENHSLAIGDTVQVHGSRTGVIEFTIESMRNEDQVDITTAEKMKATFPVPVEVRRGDKVYKIEENAP